MAKSLNGVTVPHQKSTEELPGVKMPTPKTVKIIMAQHIGTACQPTVVNGDKVKIGQLVGDSDALYSAPIHTGVSGIVTGIEKVVHPKGFFTDAVVIESDEVQELCEDLHPPRITDHQSFIKAVRDSGMIGLGGAGFPTHIKFNPPNLSEVNTLIINGAECEPYITSDYRTMMDDSDNLFLGIETTMKFLGINRTIICIESNKPRAIESLGKKATGYTGIEVKTLTSIYPQGAEKVMIYHAMDGLTVPEGGLPADVGVIVSNVTTLAKLGDFFRTGMPLVENCVTVDGGAVREPKNVIIPTGAKIKDVIDFCGGYKTAPSKIVFGGPMMGVTMETDDFPVLKHTNAITVFTKEESTYFVETPCIRCGECMRVCPMNLMPFNMKAATKRKDVERLKQLKANICIECGCCSYVCPAMQELVQSHIQAKSLLKNAQNLAKGALNE